MTELNSDISIMFVEALDNEEVEDEQILDAVRVIMGQEPIHNVHSTKD